MKIIFIFSLMSMVLSQEQYHYILSVKNYEFETNNLDSNAFGYMDFEDDRDKGVISCFLDLDVAFFADNYHNNIKSVNLTTGELKASNRINPWVEDLAIVDDKLCLLYKDQSMLILDKFTLLILDSLELPIGNKVFVENENGISIVNKSNRKYKDSINKIECYNLFLENNKNFIIEHIQKSEINKRIGYSNTIQIIDDRKFIIYSESNYEIPTKVKPDWENGFFNIYIDDNTLLNYSQDQEKLRVIVLNY